MAGVRLDVLGGEYAISVLNCPAFVDDPYSVTHARRR
jgi:hypothetical protein